MMSISSIESAELCMVLTALDSHNENRRAFDMQEKRKTVYLLRHGDTGLRDRYIGSTDVPLCTDGYGQVKSTGKILQQEGISKIFCSPMLRCRQSYEQLELNGPCHYDGLLKEVDFGRWEGQRFAEIVESDAEHVDLWIKDPLSFKFPEGESLSEFQRRVTAFKEKLLAENSDKILLVTHGGVIRYLLCLLLGLPIEKYLLFDIQPGCFCSLNVYSGGSVLTGFNIKG